MILITSYNRPDMLLRLLKELEGEKVAVIDDGSTYSPIKHMQYCDYYRTEHKGKAGFWVLWNLMFDIARDSSDDWFLFLQDDVRNVQIDKIKHVTRGLDKFAFNIMRRGEERGWTNKPWTESNLNGLICWNGSYVDCVFATNRYTLNKIRWKVDPVPIWRFQSPLISSGVGQNLSKQFFENDIPMFIPKKSLAYHGDHPSKMHPARKVNNMISK